MAILLVDDGTLDTVLRCSKCQEEFRFTYMGVEETGCSYKGFVKSCLEDVKEEHECSKG